MIFKFILSFNGLWFLFINLQSNVILRFIFAWYKKKNCWKNKVWQTRLMEYDWAKAFFSLFPFFTLQVHLFDSNWLVNYKSLFILITLFPLVALKQIIFLKNIVCDSVPESLKWISLHLIRDKVRIQLLIYFPKTHNLLKILQGRKYPNDSIELAIQVTSYPFSLPTSDSSFTTNSINIY